MATYDYRCSCGFAEEAFERIADRDKHACPKCKQLMERQPVFSIAVRPDPFGWSDENGGRGRYIGQLQRTLGSKKDPAAYCKNRQEAIDKAHRRGYSVDKSVY